MSSNLPKYAAGAAAVVAIGIGAAAVGSASSGNETRTGNQTGGMAAGQAPPGMNQNQQAGNGPPGAGAAGGPGMGTAVTGATADKVEAAALAEYPGEIERIEQLPDGSYVAHVIQDDGAGEVHVAVDKDFNVTGKQARPNGPPPGGMMPPGANGRQPPSGSGAQPPAGSGAETETN